MIVVSVCLPSDALSQRLQSYLSFSYLGLGVSLHGCSSKVQLLSLTLDAGLLLAAAPVPHSRRLVKAMVFPVVMYGCESWTIKKAERRRIDAFELWCCRRLEIPLDCKEIKPVSPKGNQS